MDQLQSSAPPATLSTVNIQVADITSNSVIVEYAGLPGNMPATYHNSLYLFKASTPNFPYGTTDKPVASLNIPGNTSAGTAVLQGMILIGNSYCLGYAVGPVLQPPAQLYGNVCTTAWIPPSGEECPVTMPELMLNYVSPSVIAVSFRLGSGLTPAANGAWVGLWQGNYPSYTIPPTYKEAITTNMPEGQVVLNVIVLRGMTYSLGLFMSGWSASGAPVQTTLAATLTFSS